MGFCAQSQTHDRKPTYWQRGENQNHPGSDVTQIHKEEYRDLLFRSRGVQRKAFEGYCILFQYSGIYKKRELQSNKGRTTRKKEISRTEKTVTIRITTEVNSRALKREISVGTASINGEIVKLMSETVTMKFIVWSWRLILPQLTSIDQFVVPLTT